MTRRSMSEAHARPGNSVLHVKKAQPVVHSDPFTFVEDQEWGILPHHYAATGAVLTLRRNPRNEGFGWEPGSRIPSPRGRPDLGRSWGDIYKRNTQRDPGVIGRIEAYLSAHPGDAKTQLRGLAFEAWADGAALDAAVARILGDGPRYG